MNKLRELNKTQNVTFFISSHILPELEQLVNSVTLIDKGKLIIEDSMDKIKKGFVQDTYILNTSDNEKILDAIKAKPYVKQIELDQNIGIRVICTNVDALQLDLMNIVAQNKLRLISFGEETIGLEGIYSESIDTGGEL